MITWHSSYLVAAKPNAELKTFRRIGKMGWGSNIKGSAPSVQSTQTIDLTFNKTPREYARTRYQMKGTVISTREKDHLQSISKSTDTETVHPLQSFCPSTQLPRHLNLRCTSSCKLNYLMNMHIHWLVPFEMLADNENIGKIKWLKTFREFNSRLMSKRPN